MLVASNNTFICIWMTWVGTKGGKWNKTKFSPTPLHRIALQLTKRQPFTFFFSLSLCLLLFFPCSSILFYVCFGYQKERDGAFRTLNLSWLRKKFCLLGININIWHFVVGCCLLLILFIHSVFSQNAFMLTKNPPHPPIYGKGFLDNQN